jgi:dTDP-4-dehydrorhamnose reductase
MAIVVLGAGGRLGQLLRPVFPVEALWHSRKDVDIENTDTLCHALAQADAVICLAGATIGSARAMQMNVTDREHGQCLQFAEFKKKVSIHKIAIYRPHDRQAQKNSMRLLRGTINHSDIKGRTYAFNKALFDI